MTSGETSVLEIGPPVPTPEALRAASISEKQAPGDTKDHSLTGIPAVTSIFPLRSLITQYVAAKTGGTANTANASMAKRA